VSIDTSGRLPTITVGLATLDRYPYIATLLVDLAAPTHLPDEVVVVDQMAPRKRQPIPTTGWSHAFPVRVACQETHGIAEARKDVFFAYPGMASARRREFPFESRETPCA
jgi:hypothetical protein